MDNISVSCDDRATAQFLKANKTVKTYVGLRVMHEKMKLYFELTPEIGSHEWDIIREFVTFAFSNRCEAEEEKRCHTTA